MAPWISKWMTLLGLKSGPSWLVGPFRLAWDAKERVEWAQPEYDISSGQGLQRRNPSASPAARLYTAAGAAEAAAKEGRASGTLGADVGCGRRRGGGGRAGAWSGGPSMGSGALAHPRTERMSSSCLRHCGPEGEQT